MKELPEVLTVEEVAKYLNLKRSTAYDLVKRRIIPSAKLGRQIRIKKSDVENLFKR